MKTVGNICGCSSSNSTEFRVAHSKSLRIRASAEWLKCQSTAFTYHQPVIRTKHTVFESERDFYSVFMPDADFFFYWTHFLGNKQHGMLIRPQQNVVSKFIWNLFTTNFKGFIIRWVSDTMINCNIDMQTIMITTQSSAEDRNSVLYE